MFVWIDGRTVVQKNINCDIPGMWNRGNGWKIPKNALRTVGLSSKIVSFQIRPGRIRQIIQETQKTTGERVFPEWMENYLMPHQAKALVESYGHTGFSFWAPPGSGKTLTGLVWLEMSHCPYKIVVTKAAARGTWKEEIRRCTTRQPVVLKGKKDLQVEWDPDVIYITAWETLINWVPHILKTIPDKYALVFDEIHQGKNRKRVKPVLQKSGKTKFVPLKNMTANARRLADKSHTRLGLTATPIPNRLQDLWAQLDLIEPWAWGGFHKWAEKYCAAFQNGYGWDYTGTSNLDELKERLEYSKYKTSQAAISSNLPDKRRQIVYLDHDEQNAPGGFKNDIKQAAKTGDKGHLFETLLQEAASRKRQYIVERVLEAVASKQKVVVFTGRRKDCEVLGAAIDRKLPSGVPMWCAHGGASSIERDAIRKDYMETGGGAVLVGTGHAWGESINLQDTDLALFVMLPWTPRDIRQWEGRFCRLGQKRPVLVSYVIAEGTVDEQVADVLLAKLPAVGKVAEDAQAVEIEEAFGAEDGSTLLNRIASLL